MLPVRYLILIYIILCCVVNAKAQHISQDEYKRLMGLSVREFDQTEHGWRKYVTFYPEVTRLMKDYITQNDLSPKQVTNIQWHIGQICAMNGNYPDAIEHMSRSYSDTAPRWWNLYVKGSIAFLQKDKVTLKTSLDSLKMETEKINLNVLEKLYVNFDSTYHSAYNK